MIKIVSFKLKIYFNGASLVISDDKMGETATDNRGRFNFSGKEHELTQLEPYLYIVSKTRPSVSNWYWISVKNSGMY